MSSTLLLEYVYTFTFICYHMQPLKGSPVCSPWLLALADLTEHMLHAKGNAFLFSDAWPLQQCEWWRLGCPGVELS
jgi:hypothetical protein